MSNAIINDNLKFAGNTYKKLKNTLFTTSILHEIENNN